MTRGRRPRPRAGPGSRSGRDAAHRRYLDAYAQHTRAADLEERLAAAWPARSLLELDGWRLRLGPGLPAVAASAWPRADGGRVPLRVRLEGTARFYHESGLPARVLVGPAARPAGLDEALAQRGWRREQPHQLRTAPVATLQAPRRDGAVTVTTWTTAAGDAPPAGWLAAWAQQQGRTVVEREGAAAALARVSAPARWAWASDAGVGLGVARGVLDGGWLGLADLDAASEEVGAALLADLLAWARTRGAEHAWWLVPEGSALAERLAREAGLRAERSLHLRVLPPSTPRRC